MTRCNRLERSSAQHFRAAADPRGLLAGRRQRVEARGEQLADESVESFRMRRGLLLEALDEAFLELAGERDEALELVEATLFATVGPSGVGRTASLVGGRLPHAVGQLEALVLFEVGLFHAAIPFDQSNWRALYARARTHTLDPYAAGERGHTLLSHRLYHRARPLRGIPSALETNPYSARSSPDG